MSETMESVFSTLAVEPYGCIDDRVLSALRHLFGEREINEIGNLRLVDLVNEIAARREAVGLPAGVMARDVARDLLDYMRKMEFTAARPEQVVKIVQDKAVRDMNLRELLEALVADPSRYDELLPHIDADPQVRQAELNAPNWAVTVRGQENKLDIPATLERVNRLIRHSIVQPTMSDGRYPTLLAQVFDRHGVFMLNPFFTTIHDLVVQGPVFRDFNLGNLPEEIHLAYIWARKEEHPVWPGAIDVYEHLPQAFAEKLSGRWLEIVEAYRGARRNNDPSTHGLSRYMSPEDISPRGRLPFGGSTQRDDKWYKEQLEEYCGREVHVSSGSDQAARCIVSYVQVSSGQVHLDNVISLGRITVTSGDIYGTAWAPQGARVRATSGRLSRGVQTLSWKRLYEKAIELGIIPER